MRKAIVFIVSILLLLSFCTNSICEAEKYEEMSLEELNAILESVRAELSRRADLEKQKESLIPMGDTQYTVSELTDMCAAIGKVLAERNDPGTFDVPVGTWTVGKHLKAGVYTIVPQNKNDHLYFDVTMPQWGKRAVSFSSETESGSIRHVLLKDGDTVEIKYHGATFTAGSYCPQYEGADPARSPMAFADCSDGELQKTYMTITQLLAGQTVPQITLPGGVWIVGEDIPAGSYDIEAYLEESSGNYKFYIFKDTEALCRNSSETAMFGYGKDHETSASNIALSDGAVIFTNGCSAKLTVADTEIFFGPR